jgi:hypothetical protein
LAAVLSRGPMLPATQAVRASRAPVLRTYLTQLRFIVGPYFDVTPASPDAAFIAEAPHHPVFLLADSA